MLVGGSGRARTAFLCKVDGAVGGGAVGGEEGVEAGEELRCELA